ncbi:MAG: heme ABC transporter ATP-binding protein [Verrucomicrobiota bacterium]
MLSAKNISVSKGQTEILHEINLSVKPGALTAVLGPNGAGKSTLLEALTGECEPTKGEIHLAGKPLEDWNPLSLSKMRAVLTQSPDINFPFTVLEVVLMGRSPHYTWIENEQDFQIAQEALKSVDMASFAERSFPTLSGGEKQRVQLARVLAQIWDASENGCRYLLLDEPTSSLDIAHQHLVLKLAKQYAKDQVAVFAILHDINQATQYADHLLFLKNGEQVAVGPPEDIISKEVIEHVYGIKIEFVKHPSSGRQVIVI